ncbi:MAG: hypothetical protein C0401_03645 [Anaerolinea sp.]|nr:hypothetical protein [Anaerolinea sp.]
MKKNVFYPLILISAFILIVGSACGFSLGGDTTKTEEPKVIVVTATPETFVNAPTEAPIVVPTEAPAEPSVTEPPAFFVEEFDTDMDNYSYWLQRGDEKKMDLRNENGKLKFDLNGDYIWPYVTYDPFTYTDVRIDIEAENMGSNNNSVTMVCRYSEDLGWYEFNIENDGEWFIAYYDNVIAKGYLTLYDGGSTAIKMGRDTNIYTAICQGNELTLYINGVKTRTVEHKDLKEGQVGIGVSSYENYPVKVYINWMEISEP